MKVIFRLKTHMEPQCDGEKSIELQDTRHKNSRCDAPPTIFEAKTLDVMLQKRFLDKKTSMWCSAKVFWSKNSRCDGPSAIFETKTLDVMLQKRFLKEKLLMWWPKNDSWNKNSRSDGSQKIVEPSICEVMVTPNFWTLKRDKCPFCALWCSVNS